MSSSFSSWAEGNIVIDSVVSTIRVIIAYEGAAHVIEGEGVNCWRSLFHPFEVWKDVLHPSWVLGNASLSRRWYWDSFFPPVGTSTAGVSISTLLIARARCLSAAFHPAVGLTVEWSTIVGAKSTNLGG